VRAQGDVATDRLVWPRKSPIAVLLTCTDSVPYGPLFCLHAYDDEPRLCEQMIAVLF